MRPQRIYIYGCSGQAWGGGVKHSRPGGGAPFWAGGAGGDLSHSRNFLVKGFVYNVDMGCITVHGGIGMAEVEVLAWKCDVCGYIWLRLERVPTFCANRRCRSRRWNRGNVLQVNFPGAHIASPLTKESSSMGWENSVGVTSSIIEARVSNVMRERVCRSCEDTLLLYNGKWVCSSLECGLYGVEQR